MPTPEARKTLDDLSGTVYAHVEAENAKRRETEAARREASHLASSEAAQTVQRANTPKNHESEKAAPRRTAEFGVSLASGERNGPVPTPNTPETGTGDSTASGAISGPCEPLAVEAPLRTRRGRSCSGWWT